MGKRFISWRRVSTFRQSKSGLGLEAQKEIIRYFIEREGGDWIADYEECYTGKELNGCVQLHKAMEHAKATDSVLIIAKSDRFRNTAEALKIYEEMGDGRIMFCDLPATDKFTLTLFFALAEREALIVSIRTKQALAVKKAQGCKLGAASEKYKETANKKEKEEKEKEAMERGETKRQRHQSSRDVQVFLRILRQVFPDETKQKSVERWNWERIRTRCGRKELILAKMQDYQELDEDGKLFRGWDFSLGADNRTLSNRLCAYIQSIRKSFTSNK